MKRRDREQLVLLFVYLSFKYIRYTINNGLSKFGTRSFLWFFELKFNDIQIQLRFYGTATQFKGNRIHIHETLVSKLSDAKKFSLLCTRAKVIKWMRKMKCKWIWENHFKTIIISANIGKLIAWNTMRKMAGGQFTHESF